MKLKGLLELDSAITSRVFDVAVGPADTSVINALLSAGNGTLTVDAPLRLRSTGPLGATRQLNLTSLEANHGRIVLLDVANSDITTNNLQLVATADINGGGPTLTISAATEILLVHSSAGNWKLIYLSDIPLGSGFSLQIDGSNAMNEAADISWTTGLERIQPKLDIVTGAAVDLLIENPRNGGAIALRLTTPGTVTLSLESDGLHLAGMNVHEANTITAQTGQDLDIVGDEDQDVELQTLGTGTINLNATDDITVTLASGKKMHAGTAWALFDDGTGVFGGNAPSASEKLRVVGAGRVEGDLLITGAITQATRIALPEQVSDPTQVADQGMLYTKDDGGDTELYYIDDGGAVAQLTEDGGLKLTGTDAVLKTPTASQTIALPAAASMIITGNSAASVDIFDVKKDTTSILTVVSAGTLAINAGTLATLPAAGGFVVNGNDTPSVDIFDVQKDGTPKLTVDTAGDTTVAGTLTVGAQEISDASGNLASANGVASFGPSAVTSITIVNGIVTAIS